VTLTVYGVTVVSVQNADRERYTFYLISRQWTKVCTDLFIIANERLQRH